MVDLYSMLKNLINNNRYEKEDMTNKLNVFYMYDQITREQYEELMTQINTAEKEKEEV